MPAKKKTDKKSPDYQQGLCPVSPPNNGNGDTTTNDREEALHSIAEYFTPTADPDEIVYLWSLRQQAPRLDSFLGLFRGSLDSVMIRLLVLDEMVSRATQPAWTIEALTYALGYLSETAFATVTKKLKDAGLVAYDRSSCTYSVTPLGQKVKALVTSFLKDTSEDSIEILTGLALASDFMGTLGEDELKHLLHRLSQIEMDIITSVESASEVRILKAREQFEHIWKYIEKGTEFISRITQEATLEPEIHTLAQQVGYAQSRLAKATGIFQKALNDIDKQRVHLGNSGVSTTNLNKYLINLSIDDMEKLIADVLYNPIAPILIEANLLADTAEGEIVDKQRSTEDIETTPELVYSPQGTSPEYDMEHLYALIQDIMAIKETVPLSDIIPRRTYEESAYRLSMASFAGTTTSQAHDASEDPMATLTALLATAVIEPGTDTVGKHGVASISKGVIIKMEKNDK